MHIIHMINMSNLYVRMCFDAKSLLVHVVMNVSGVLEVGGSNHPTLSFLNNKQMRDLDLLYK